MKATIENFPQKMKLDFKNKTAVLSCLDDTYRYCDYPEWVALQPDILKQFLEHPFDILLYFDRKDIDNPSYFLISSFLGYLFLPVLIAFILIVVRILLHPLLASQLIIQRTDIVKKSSVTSFLESFIDIKNNDQNSGELPLSVKKWLIAQSTVRLEEIKGLSDEKKSQLRR